MLHRNPTEIEIVDQHGKQAYWHAKKGATGGVYWLKARPLSSLQREEFEQTLRRHPQRCIHP
jgi:hypothetical protein